MSKDSIFTQMKDALGTLIVSAGWTRGLLQVKAPVRKDQTKEQWAQDLMYRLRVAAIKDPFDVHTLRYKIEHLEVKGSQMIARINTAYPCFSGKHIIWNDGRMCDCP
jgi:hypothetical protein